MTRLYDISITLHGDTPPWPGDTPFTCEWPWLLAKGASVNVSALTASPHVGTHADAPLHVRDGWPGAHDLRLESFFGPALVVDITGEEDEISLEAFTRALGQEPDTALKRCPRLLLRTGRSIADGVFPARWPVPTVNCARALLGFGLQLLGTDAPSVDLRESRALDVHQAIFERDGAILENLDLRLVTPGEYELMAFPLKLLDTDAAPVRAVLRGI